MKWPCARRLRSVSAIFAAAVLGALVVILDAGRAQDGASAATAQSNPLDGLRFSAGIVRDADEDAEGRPLEDQLIFEDGLFSSVVCKRYNFTAAPYWIRREGDRIHFLAELSSPTDGKMVWQGSVRNGELVGTMRWTRKRWYWTINAEHTIRGKLNRSAPAASASKN